MFGEAGRGWSKPLQGYLTNADTALDPSDDGASKPLRDDLVLMRYLFGFSGDSLTSGAVDDGAVDDGAVDDGAERDAGEEVEADITARIAAQSLRSYRRWRKTRSNALDSSSSAPLVYISNADQY